MANLFTSQTPAVTDASDGAPGITTATTVRFAQSGTITGVRFYATTTVSGTYIGQLYQVTGPDAGGTPSGTLLATKTAGATPTGGTWNTITFDTPVSVATATLYRACLFSGAGRYVATNGFFDSFLTSGDITADVNGDNPVGLGVLRNGSFAINASAAYPSSGGGASYFVDVEFTAGAAPATITPDSLTLATALGQPTITLPRALAGSATASARLGAPTVTTPAPDPGASTGGGWNTLRAIALANRERARIQRERDRHPVECPVDGWPLKQTPSGYYCEFGGHIVAPR